MTKRTVLTQQIELFPKWSFEGAQQLIDFLACQGVVFVCTVDRNGHCAVNHRGGKCGFISVNGVHGKARLLLPEYAGNGAFEAVGNIWETRRAAVFVPDSERGYWVCVSGPAELFYGEVLQTEPFVRFSGAQRVLAIDPLDCQVQSWNDDLGPEEETAMAATQHLCHQAEVRSYLAVRPGKQAHWRRLDRPRLHRETHLRL